jgi:hypothetical protein
MSEEKPESPKFTKTDITTHTIPYHLVADENLPLEGYYHTRSFVSSGLPDY